MKLYYLHVMQFNSIEFFLTPYDISYLLKFLSQSLRSGEHYMVSTGKSLLCNCLRIALDKTYATYSTQKALWESTPLICMDNHSSNQLNHSEGQFYDELSDANLN